MGVGGRSSTLIHKPCRLLAPLQLQYEFEEIFSLVVRIKLNMFMVVRVGLLRSPNMLTCTKRIARFANLLYDWWGGGGTSHTRPSPGYTPLVRGVCAKKNYTFPMPALKLIVYVSPTYIPIYHFSV